MHTSLYYTYAVMALSFCFWQFRIVRNERLSTRDEHWIYRITSKAFFVQWGILAMVLSPHSGFWAITLLSVMMAWFVDTQVIFRVMKRIHLPKPYVEPVIARASAPVITLPIPAQAAIIVTFPRPMYGIGS